MSIAAAGNKPGSETPDAASVCEAGHALAGASPTEDRDEDLAAEQQPDSETVPAAALLISDYPTPQPGTGSHHSEGWVWQVTALSIGLGALLALAIRTTEHIRSLGLPANRFGVPVTTLSRYKEHNEKLEQEVRSLREEVSKFEFSRGSGSRTDGLLRKQLLDYQAVLGVAAVKGPGLEITLRNSPLKPIPGTVSAAYQATDTDVNALVSELWAAGAEAIAVGGVGARELQRFVVSTTVRPAPRGILINGLTLGPPFRILAIGNSHDLNAALKMPEGIVQQSGVDVLKMITIKETDHLVLPAAAGSRSAHNPTPNS